MQELGLKGGKRGALFERAVRTGSRIEAAKLVCAFWALFLVIAFWAPPVYAAEDPSVPPHFDLKAPSYEVMKKRAQAPLNP